MTHLDNWQAKFATTRPRRLLALDGGGIRGVMSLEILRKIEQDLATATGKGVLLSSAYNSSTELTTPPAMV